MPQTNKEFVDALDIRPEDGFLAVAVRRAAAWQLGKEIVDLETETVGEPDFYLPWDGKQFGFLLEKELDIVIPFREARFSDSLILIQQEYSDWFRGPAIKMPMKQWTEIAVQKFFRPVREKISCPSDWTFFEPEKSNELPGPSGCVLCALFALGTFLTILSVLSGYYGIIVGLMMFTPLAILFWVLFFGNILRSLKRKSPITRLPHCQLLGTMTFHSDTLRFADEDQLEETAQIPPGDYRFFLIRMEDFTPSLAVLTTLSDPPSHFDFESAPDTQQFEIAIDSGMIGIMEQDEPSSSNWIQNIPSYVVHRIQQRDDKTVCGIKLLPTYGDGGYKVIVNTTPTSCLIMVELQTPPED